MNVQTSPVIVTNAVTRRFGDVVAVDHLSLEIFPGEVFGLLGHNGAGKTTTVRLLNGILEPNGGTARVLGLDPVADGPALRRRTGVLTETPSLDERLTGRENLCIYADLYGVRASTIPGRVRELLEAFELWDRAEEKVGAYSKGMKQRLALARALLHEPELLFLDEPTAALDPVAARHVHDLILKLSHTQKHTVALCTHNLAEAQRLCDRVAVLEHGHLLVQGTPAELAHRYGGRVRLEVEVAPSGVPAALETVRDRLGLADVVLQGETLAVAGMSREAIPELVAALVAAGVRVYRVAPQEPTLEDVYFALHGEEVRT